MDYSKVGRFQEDAGADNAKRLPSDKSEEGALLFRDSLSNLWEFFNEESSIKNLFYFEALLLRDFIGRFFGRRPPSWLRDSSTMLVINDLINELKTKIRKTAQSFEYHIFQFFHNFSMIFNFHDSPHNWRPVDGAALCMCGKGAHHVAERNYTF